MIGDVEECLPGMVDGGGDGELRARFQGKPWVLWAGDVRPVENKVEEI